MQFLTDFHSHILPGIDDGSDSLETSLRLLEQSRDQGVRHIFATPHFYAHQANLDTFLEDRARAEESLRRAVEGREDLPTFSVGAEVFFFRGISETDAMQNLTLGDSHYILVEMPLGRWRDDMYRELEKIRERQGLTPVMAHVERYFGTFSTHGIPEQLAQLPVLTQCNASFFLNRKTRARALRLLKQGRIHLLGSDCHDTQIRRPNLGDAVGIIEKSQEAIQWLEACSARVYPHTEP